MIISLREIADMLIMSGALGFIFMDSFKKFKPGEFGYSHGFDWSAFKFAIIITAPVIILHELGHKFVAMSYGLQATFYAAYLWLFIGVLLKLMNSPFIFFVPAFVSFPAMATPIQNSIIAFAGPAVNGLLWLAAHVALKKNLVKKKKYIPHIYLFKYLNGFLFLFNMIPIPPFDGGQVVFGLGKAIFG